MDWLYHLQKSRIHQKKKYDTASDGKDPILYIFGVWSTPSLPLLPGPLWTEVVLPVRVS